MSFTCEKSDFEREFKKEDVETEVAYLKEKALSNGFALRKATGNKKNSFYFECHRSGKVESKGDGKRAKPSKRISNYLIYLSSSSRLPI